MKRYENAHKPYIYDFIANHTIMDDDSWHLNRLINHISLGTIKIKFYDILDKKKVDKINITKPFVIYAMKKSESATSTGKDAYRYSRPLSRRLFSISDVSFSQLLRNSRSGFDIKFDEEEAKTIALKNKLIDEYDFLKTYKFNRKGKHPVDIMWKIRNLHGRARSISFINKTGFLADKTDSFKLNSYFFEFYSIYKKEVITVEDFLSRILERNPIRKFVSTKVKIDDCYFTVAKKCRERDNILNQLALDPSLITLVHDDDINDKDFIMRVGLISITSRWDNVGQHGDNYLSLDKLPSKFQDDEDVALRFLCRRDNGKYISSRLLTDKSFITKAMTSSNSILPYISNDLRNDFEYMKSLLSLQIRDCEDDYEQVFWNHWPHAGEDLRNSREYAYYVFHFFNTHSSEYGYELEWGEGMRNFLSDEMFSYCMKYPKPSSISTLDSYYELKDMGNRILDRPGSDVVKPKTNKI